MNTRFKIILTILISMLFGCATNNSYLDTRIHVVNKGDTLSQIAKQYDMSVAELQDLNDINDPRLLKIGTRLKLIASKSNPTRAAKPKQEAKTLQHHPIKTVKQTFIWPLKKVDISSSFGRRFLFDNHKGIDLRAPLGTPVLAAADGVVIYSGRPHLWGGYGNLIKLKHPGNFLTLYAHNNRNLVTVGQKVKKGQTIATVGSTGNATGNHVHFEIRLNGRHQNPESYLK